MTVFSGADPKTSIPGIRKELEQLRDSVPMYASWLLPELSRAADRYATILHWIAAHKQLRVPCRGQLESLPSIKAFVAQATKSGDWRPFNKAANLLRWDIEELMSSLPE